MVGGLGRVDQGFLCEDGVVELLFMRYEDYLAGCAAALERYLACRTGTSVCHRALGSNINDRILSLNGFED